MFLRAEPVIFPMCSECREANSPLFGPAPGWGRPRGSRGREEIGPLEQGLLMWKDHRPRGPMESDACFLQDSHHLKWSESTLIQIK